MAERQVFSKPLLKRSPQNARVGYRLHRRVSAVKVIAILTGALAFAGPVRAQVLQDVQIETPREYAYVVGDEFVHRVQVTLQDGFEIDPEQLPEAGRITLWLELDTPRVERSEQTWVVELPYRLINRVPRSTSLVVPQQFIEAVGANRSVSVLVAEWSFTQNPVVPSAVTEMVADHDVRADRPPLPLTTHRARVGMWVPLALVALVSGALAWIYLILPWLRPRARPFAEAMDKLRALPADWNEETEKHALQTLHGALNETAGHALFSGGLDGFLKRYPEFAPLGPRLEQLFTRSNTLFFESGDAREALSEDDITRLCRDCLAVERRR